jgi:hypothetical protein
MKRAEFLKVMGAGTLVALAGSAVTACKSSSTTPSNPDSHTFTSTGPSSGPGHTHTITIQKTEVETPPAGGISRETSTNGHSHTFTMTADQLATVKAGTAVTITTQPDSTGHTHDFQISKWY